MPRFPRGLLVVGDALCSLNPIYGQGMTMAALQALTLRQCLRTDVTDLAAVFFAGAARDIDPIWQRNRAEERAPSPVGAHRSVRHRLRRSAVKATLTAASRDTRVAERLVRVGHLLDPPTSLIEAALLPRIAAANLRHLAGRVHRGWRRQDRDVRAHRSTPWTTALASRIASAASYPIR